MTPRTYWDEHLTHKGRELVLCALGRALGYQLFQWAALPEDLQSELVALWALPKT
jgi:hypothetical protein